MLLSQFHSFEIIDISTGTRRGGFGEGDALFDERTGKIKALVVPGDRAYKGFFSSGDYDRIPWESIRKIGRDIIIVESEREYD